MADAERPIDRVSAAGAASIDGPLGLLAWKSLDGLDSQAYRRLEEQLYRIYRSRYGDVPEIAAAVVSQALHEFMVPKCPQCQGTREVMAGELKGPCPQCANGVESTGLHRYTDTERATSMKISYGQTKRAAHKIRYLINLLATAYRSQALLTTQQLERQ